MNQVSISGLRFYLQAHFHESGLRTEELKRTAAEHQVRCVTIPKIFKIRWTEWTAKTIVGVLKSLVAIVKYCEVADNATAAGFAKYLKNVEHLKLMVFLADLLQVYQRYHKHIQSDNLTIVSLHKHIGSLKASLQQLEDHDTIGGWAERLREDTIYEEETVRLKSIELEVESATRSVGSRSFDEIRSDIINKAIEIIERRFLPDEQLIEIVQPFIKEPPVKICIFRPVKIFLCILKSQSVFGLVTGQA